MLHSKVSLQFQLNMLLLCWEGRGRDIEPWVKVVGMGEDTAYCSSSVGKER